MDGDSVVSMRESSLGLTIIRLHFAIYFLPLERESDVEWCTARIVTVAQFARAGQIARE